MIKIEEKFIVFNLKDLDLEDIQVEDALSFLSKHIKKNRKQRDATLDPRYWVCNKDEKYADKVLELILAGEQEKETREESKKEITWREEGEREGS